MALGDVFLEVLDDNVKVSEVARSDFFEFDDGRGPKGDPGQDLGGGSATIPYATSQEATAGSASDKVISPATLKVVGDTKQPHTTSLDTVSGKAVAAYGANLLELSNQAALMALLQYATTGVSGVVKLSDGTTAITGTDGTVAVTPVALKAVLDNFKTTLVAGAPTLLDTFDELAAAMGDDPNFATTVMNSLAGKQPKTASLDAVSARTVAPYGADLLTLTNQAGLMALIQYATTGVSGVVKLSDGTTAIAGTDGTLAVTPLALKAVIDNFKTSLVAGAPTLLDTFDELAAAMGDDPNFATTVMNSLAGKQPLSSTLTTLAGTTPSATGLAILQAPVLASTDPSPTTPGVFLQLDAAT